MVHSLWEIAPDSIPATLLPWSQFQCYDEWLNPALVSGDGLDPGLANQLMPSFWAAVIGSEMGTCSKPGQ